MLSTGNSDRNNEIKNELASKASLKSSYQITAEWNYNAYIKYSEIGCVLGNGSNQGSVDDGYQIYNYTVGETTGTITDVDRIKYTPLKDIFKTNRPNPGIIHSVTNGNNPSKALNGDGDSLSITRIFNMSSEDTRLYPISENSPFKYWSSLRNKNGSVIGLSESDTTILNANPYIIYSENIYVNKIVIKTQKHLGYVKDFDIYTRSGSTWSKIYSVTNSTDLQNGILSIYYDKTQETDKWVKFDIASKNNPIYSQQDEKTVVDFSKTSLSLDMVEINGIRFVAKKMSEANIPLEVIEISPRLVADISNNVISLDINSSIGNSAYGIPIGSIVSSSGSITLSNDLNYFNKNNSDSILQNILKPNVEIKIYQKLDVFSESENTTYNYRFPLKTLYTDIWDDANGYTVSISLEDYFKFFKEMAAPDLMIANNTGVPTSVALLMLFDNIGFSGFRMEKTSSLNDFEDVVLDFFHSQKEKTVMEVLESVAISTQTSIYMDVDNEIVAMTKEKSISPETKDFWFSGNAESFTKNNISYIENIQSFEENSEAPITDVSVEYVGLGLEKKSLSLIENNDNKKQEHLESSNFGVSFINKNLKYVPDIVWQTGNDKNSSENYLAAAAVISDIPLQSPMQYFSDKTEVADNKYDAIRQFYARSSEAKSKMCLYLDDEMINTFSNTYSGYVMVDSEIIRYNGILFFISNPLEKTLKRKILFSKEEYNFEKSRLRQGGTIEPKALVIYMDFSIEVDSVTPSKNLYTLISDGRGQNKTEIVEHKGVNTNKEFLVENSEWEKHSVHLWTSNKVPSTITNGLTVTNRIDNFISNKTSGTTMTSKSVPGYIYVSAAKSGDSIKSSRKESQSIKDWLPMNSSSEQLLSGIFKEITRKVGETNVSIPIRRIGTRMRLVSDVPKNVSTGENLIKDGVIAGLGWGISYDSTGYTGYFVEVEDIGTISEAALMNENYRNLRLYKVYGSGHKVKVLNNAWVNVSTTPKTAPDMGSALVDATGGKSYAQIFDLEVVIRTSNGKKYYEVYWDDQQVISANENVSDALTDTSKAGFIVRGKSSAIYEYLYVSSTPDDIIVPKQTGFVTKKKDAKLSTLVSRGILPKTFTTSIGKSNVYTYFDDFGKYAREVKKFDVRFDSPSLRAEMISLADVNPNYYVSDYQPSSFGASFWLYNTSNTAIKIDESAQTPLWISAFALKQISPGTIQSSKFIEKSEYDKVDNDMYSINRNIYGKQEVLISGEYINNMEQAKKLSEWIINNLSKERKTINLSIFPNPLLELGDKVGLKYNDKLYTNEDKTYSIVSISHNISNSGPSMSVQIRECV